VEALIMAGQLILGLTILVGVHELGHMLTAKWFGMRVEKFAIGFPPKVVSKQFGETEYMIGAIPLGGFVKISGMVDESLDTAALSKEPEPYEFRAKPAWQRLIVMMGGIIVNVLVGILIFTIITYKYGESYLPASEARYGIIANDLGKQMGFQTGDKIVKINGKPFQNFDQVYDQDVLLNRGGYYTVQRNGQLIDIKVPVDLMDRMADKGDARFVETIFPFEVGQVVAKENAADAGLKTGDKFISVNGQPTPYFHTFQEALKANAGKKVPMVVNRNGAPITLNVQVDKDGKIGFAPVPLLKFATKEYTLLEAVPAGTKQAFGVVTANIKGFAKIFRGEVDPRKSLSGPIGIAKVFGGSFDWLKFWSIVGMLSMVLAFMNFLPIPALDGGHVMFLTYEMVSGRKPSDKFLENAQKVGMAVLLALMAFAIGNDVFKMFN